MFDNRVGDALRRSPLFIAYLILATATLVGFLYMERLTEKLEEQSLQRAKVQCLAGNDTRQVLANVLDVLARPQPDDEPGEYERRQQLRRQLDPLLLPQDCDRPTETVPLQELQ